MIKDRTEVKLTQIPHYSNTKVLGQFLDPRGRIIPRSKTGINAKEQRQVVKAIKRARFLALLPFTQNLH